MKSMTIIQHGKALKTGTLIKMWSPGRTKEHISKVEGLDLSNRYEAYIIKPGGCKNGNNNKKLASHEDMLAHNYHQFEALAEVILKEITCMANAYSPFLLFSC